MNRHTLPSLSMDVDMGYQEEEEITLKESTKRAYDQFKLDQKNKVGVAKRTDSPVITFRLLEIAPIDFFDDLKPLAKAVTSKIIVTNVLNFSSILNLVKSPPVNLDKKSLA